MGQCFNIVSPLLLKVMVDGIASSVTGLVAQHTTLLGTLKSLDFVEAVKVLAQFVTL